MQPETQGFFKDTQQLAEEYIRERILLLKLEAVEKSAQLASVIVTVIVIGSFVSIVLLLLSAMACFMLRELTGNWFYGLGIVIVFYVLLIAVLIIFRKNFFYKHIANFVIRIFFEKNVNDEVTN